uniref:Adenylate/guanylate cyclase n=2 Tax=unclassified Mycobacterium TaxID=2642494 RepID=A0A5Q5BGH6_MYCSS
MTASTACRTCGTEYLDGARFCHGCGAPVGQAAAHAEYKQVTVLFADVVRSMDIAAAVGAERLREIMADLVNRCSAVVQRFGGTVDKFTGDGIMAVFGAPIALEDHAIRACLAALGIQQQAAQLATIVERHDGATLELRIGLNSGQVIAGDIASPALGYTAVGEHVGWAQRMESVAAPGGVLVSDSTARLVEHVAVLGEPERVCVKGRDRPVSVRRLVGVRTPHAVAGPGEPHLVGRRWEMAAVEGIFERSIDGAGAVVALVGPPGIGKSRMAREIAMSAAGRGVEVFWSFCESHTSDVPFCVVGQLLRTIVGLPHLDEESVRTRLRTRFDEQDVLLFEDLLEIRDPATALPAIDPDARRRRLSRMVKAAAVARDSPALYIVEDAHWIDEVSDAMLADFVTVIPQTHSMVLLTHRPDFHGALSRVPGAQTLTLAPLSDSESVALARTLLGTDPSVADLVVTVAQRAAGNPFFAEEIVRDLTERHLLHGRRGAFHCWTDVADISVPATLQATIAARIDRLPPSAKQTLCAASVIGMRFDTALLDSMGVTSTVDDLLHAELIDEVKFTGHAEFAFRHPLVRAVAYESQLRSDRVALHRRLADAIESAEPSVDENAALIAEHLEAAGDPRAAYEWHMRSAAWSRQRDIRAALMSWERASMLADALPAGGSDQFTLRIAPRTFLCANGFRNRNHVGSRRFEELRELCAAAGDKASVAIAMGGLINEQLIDGRLAEASQLADELTVLLESIGDPTLTVGLALFPAAVKVQTGEFLEVNRCCDLVIELAHDDPVLGGYVIGAPLALALAIRCTAAWWLGRPGWRRDFDRAVAMAAEADPISRAAVMIYTYTNAIASGVIAADDAALHNSEEALAVTQRSVDDIAYGFALYGSAGVLIDSGSGQRERAVELLRQVREMAVDGRFYRTLIPVIDARLAEHALGRGDWSALPLLRASIDALYSGGLVAFCPWATTVLVTALLDRGTDHDLVEADAALVRLSGSTQLEGSVFCDLTLLRFRALLSRLRGDETVYRQLRDRYRAKATSLGFERHIAWAEEMP